MSPKPVCERFYYDVFGTFVRAERRSEGWHLFRQAADGKCSPLREMAVPAALDADELLIFLDDMFHEMATPEHPAVRMLG